MEVSEVLLAIKIPTQQLSSDLMQKVLIAARKQGPILQDNRNIWNNLTQTLWHHLQTGLVKFDDQLLCATCFYAMLGLSDEQEFYLNEISELIKGEIDLKVKVLKNNLNTLQAVSLMYGMFQSTYLTLNLRKNGLNDLVQTIFELLIIMAYKYSKYTFIVFKTINSFKKTFGTNLQEILFSNQNIMKLLNVVIHNWENPITGVRDLNKSIFQSLISMMDDEMYDNILKEINEFYWNKAKYLMLAEIICCSKKNINLLEYDWVNGLVNSLHKSGLVSAGADMYFSILKKIETEEQWCKIFMKPIVGLLCGNSQKGIEHFGNYWCLTTFKSYPLVADIILKQLEKSDQDNKLYSSLCIMKQANKLGLLKKNWDSNVKNYTENCIIDALEHCDNQLRMMAFDVVCVSHCKSLPKIVEYELVLHFIINHVSSDCTVLRISMLKSFSSFLIQIHMSYLNGNSDEIESLQYFCAHFQNFIVTNIQICGNYQRKITCIKLVHTFLNSLKEVPRKKLKQTRKPYKTLIQMLEDQGLWLMYEDNMLMSLLKHLKDPAEDIRDNTGQMLLEHYSTELIKKDLIHLLIQDALKSISSKFFYEISCGQSMFKLIVNILIHEKQIEGEFYSVDDILNYALKEIIIEYQLNRGIVESIEKGKQLHSLMSILHTVLVVCHEKKHIINISNEQINTLIGVLEGISKQFAWEKETSTSSDFSKISDMVHDIIVTSGYDKKVEFDQTKISGLHQIVLSCLWLNVKASCELLSLLIKYQANAQIEVCEKSLDIICHVLETCRHKGAIEAAGAALGQSIQHLTSLPEDFELSKLPLSFLKNKLAELISEAARMASVTRRGAGLSIMVHRVVSNDAKRGKPLFHYFMNTILDTCNKADFIPNTDNAIQHIDDEKDLPKAIYIHFLTRVVTDSSLASDMMFYSVELAELAFGNLTSPYWQIRNAALQLYGALIQKLIGQKKASGVEEGSIATIACDELRTHSPKLWQYILNQLKDRSVEDKVQHHSILIPILNMLANIARRYSFSFDISEHKKIHSELLDSLILLLDSPIFTVRRLTANCIYNIFSNEEIVDYLLNEDCPSENYIHGSLLLIANVLNLHCSKDTNKTKKSELKGKYADILNGREHSYLSREIFEDIFFDEIVTVENVQQTLAELSARSRMSGVFLWANKRVQKYLNCASWNMVPEILKIIITQNESETYLCTLHEKIEREQNILETELLDIANILISSENKFNSFIIWKILYMILLKIDLASLQFEPFHVSAVYDHLEEIGVLYKLRYMIPFAAKLSAMGVEKNKLSVISSIIIQLTDPETTNVEMRHIAAMANNELCSEINNLPERVKITVVKSAVVLLQDEDEQIRMLSAKFYSIATDAKKSLQPHICLSKILDHKFLYTNFSENGVCTLKKELMEYISKVCSKDVDEYNPFGNDLSNIYLEVDVFRQLIENV